MSRARRMRPNARRAARTCSQRRPKKKPSKPRLPRKRCSRKALVPNRTSPSRRRSPELAHAARLADLREHARIVLKDLLTPSALHVSDRLVLRGIPQRTRPDIVPPPVQIDRIKPSERPLGCPAQYGDVKQRESRLVHHAIKVIEIGKVDFADDGVRFAERFF